jgi:hypothetical protein
MANLQLFKKRMALPVGAIEFTTKRV